MNDHGLVFILLVELCIKYIYIIVLLTEHTHIYSTLFYFFFFTIRFVYSLLSKTTYLK